MPRERTTARRGAAGKSAKSTKPKPSRRVHGAAARQRVDEELAHQKAKEEARKNRGNEPFRFRMKQGETKEVIIVDEAPDFLIYEHTGLKDPRTNYYSLNIPCIKDYDNCPVCEHEEKESTYNLYLTIIDLTEFESRAGDVYEFSKKLLVVKTGQIKKFTRRFEKDGTLRGAKFELSRDGSKDPVIGNDIEFVEYVEEDELLEYEREWEDKDGKAHVEVCHEPYDYDELFPEMDSEELEVVYSDIFGTDVQPSAGSKRANDSEPVKRRTKKAEVEEEDEEDYDDDDEPPWDDEDDAEEEEEEKPARRSRGKAKPKAKAKAKTRRRARDDDEDEDEAEAEEEDEPAPRRRKPIRRGR